MFQFLSFSEDNSKNNIHIETFFKENVIYKNKNLNFLCGKFFDVKFSIFFLILEYK